MSARLMLLPVTKCEGCGDDLVVASLTHPECWRCQRAAILRRKLSHRREVLRAKAKRQAVRA